MKLDMIMFDVDGTIWDVSHILNRCLNEIAHKYGYSEEVPYDVVTSSLGMNEKDFSSHVFSFIDDEEKRITYLRETDELKKSVIDKEGVEPYPDFVETIKKLSAKYKIGIVSNCGANTIEQLISVLNISDYITGFAACSKFKITKGEGIKKVADENDAINICYVGDTNLDKKAAEDAGAKFVHARYGFGKEVEADYHIDSLSELERVIEEIEK